MASGVRNDRGAVLVHVAVAMVALLGVSALAIDAGVRWVARGQAQNAADAGALAGAVGLAFDDPNDFTQTGMGAQSARGYALANLVWGQAGAVDVTISGAIPPCAAEGDVCVKVDVFRNQDRNTALPTFFAQILNIREQGVVATATAQVRIGTATECLRPWAIVDRWDEVDGPEPDYPGTDPDFVPSTSTFDRYPSPWNRSPEPDLYVPPTADSPGTGWTLADYGQQFTIKTCGGQDVSSGWYRQIDLPRTDGNNQGGQAYGENIVSCNGYPVAIADPATQCPSGSAISTLEEKIYWAARGCVRVQTGCDQGNTRAGIVELYGRDPGAHWVPTLDGGRGGIGGSSHTPSPRIVPIGVMDIDLFLAADPQGSTDSAKLVNIFGFFIEGMGRLDQDGNLQFDPGDPLRQNADIVVGRLVTLPGLTLAGGPSIDPNAAFLRTILLRR